ncbi:CPBP family intramembrane glutamic endopeptidase [Thermoflexibacter ruber]|uniref:CAAX prenyl protease 2/Lysostaphin resistance protein A-like domain-containing protein n=1 Tax=Thermoflexibacter ruber TaxID=1003 RepID=A0A1I2JIW2_9BACT|nr:CPBP family intramembrane glutamic endopeptidase [Thermoflexibacter ruber]SFF53793.1 hypothetical protein SAMN04488541_105117 [Thermoflexibacter ruber]
MQEDRLQVWIDLVKMVLVLLVGFFLSNTLAFVVVLPLVNFDLEAITQLLSDPLNFPEIRPVLMIMQGVTALGLFVITPLIYIYWIDKTLSLKGLFKSNGTYLVPLILASIGVAIIEMPAITWIGKWNMEVDFPDFMDSFEQWAKLQEDKLKDLTIFLTEFRSFEQFLLGFIVIGIIPGIGEELLFRGVLQNKLKQLLGNAHVAIWLAAIIFSAFHLQFYGFVPRMLLGALFGYLYQWSGNLIYAMVAHFVNNGFTIMMMYLYQQNHIEIDIDKQEVPSDAALLSLILTALLVLVFYSMASKANPALKKITYSKDLNDRD